MLRPAAHRNAPRPRQTTRGSYYEYVLQSDRWARFRERILVERGRRCERCGARQTETDLELHHLTYERLGFERDDDVLLLCAACHRAADQAREAASRARANEAFYNARLDGWARRRFGEDWNDRRSWEDVAEAFDAWLDKNGER